MTRSLFLETLNRRLLLASDFGDAPDAIPGTTGAGEYETQLFSGGPSHTIVPGLKLGASVDGESGLLQNATANADDVDGALPDDEDGLNHPAADLALTIGAAPTVNVNVTNTTGSAATLYGWIDTNNNGLFELAERAQVAVADGTNNQTVTLTFSAVPDGFTGTTYARFRLSTDAAAGNPTGAASDGEVEDYVATIARPTGGTAASTLKIASGTGGGPTLAGRDAFGSSVTSIGDLNGDGVSDLAAGAFFADDFHGAVHVMFMNSDGTVSNSTKIASGIGGGPTLAKFEHFGSSVSSLGDLNGDNVNDLAVGVPGDQSGAVHVLFMNSDGTVSSSTKIASDIGGGPTLASIDAFGSSVTSLGDLNGDGVSDLAVGARRDETGGIYRGAVHVLLMNSDGTVSSSTKIASGTGGGPTLADFDVFGSSVTSLGDLNGDGVSDLAAGAQFDDTGGMNRGAVHVLMMNSDGTVRSSSKIASGTGGGPTLADDDGFGSSVTSLGDLNGDGVSDLVAGAARDDSGGTYHGALHVLFMNSDGTVRSSSKIANGIGGGPSLAGHFYFGSSVTSLGDLNGDGVRDLAVGAPGDEKRGHGSGAVHVLFMKAPTDYGDAPDTAAGTGSGNYNTLASDSGPSHAIVAGLKLGANVDADSGTLQNAAANADDVDQALPDDEDGLNHPAADLALTIGAAPTVNVNVTNTTGSAATLSGWIDTNNNGLFELAERAQIAVADGTNNQTVTLTFPAVPDGFTGQTYARFRLSTDTAAANPTGAASDGEVEDYVATITTPSRGTAASTVKIASGAGGAPTLANGDLFGSSVSSLGDLNGDGVSDLAVGAFLDDSGGLNRGAVHMLFMNSDGTVSSSNKIASGIGGGPTLADSDRFGISVTSLGDLNGDGVGDLAVGAFGDNTGGSFRGAVHVLFMNSDGTVNSSTKIASGTGGGPPLADADHFGISVSSLGDLNGDGVSDLAVGARGDNTGGFGRGAVHVMFMNADGTVSNSNKIASGTGGGPTLADYDGFGHSVSSLGDLNGDGVGDLAVGALFDDTGGSSRGAVHVLLMNSDGTVSSSTKIASGTGGGPTLADMDRFGSSVSSLGDLNGDGVSDLAVGAYRDSTGGFGRGAVHVLLMNSDGTVSSSTKIANGTGGGPTLANFALFGSSVSSLGDLNGDGVSDLAVGARGDDTGGPGRGAVHVLFLNPPGATGTVAFDLASSTVFEASTVHTVDVVLQLPTGDSLVNSVEVRVQDAAAGTATPGGVDYTLPVTTVTFPAGSTNGTKKSFQIQLPANDTLVEGNETFGVSFMSVVPSGADTITATGPDHEVTILDDEVASVAIQRADSVTEQGGAQSTDVTLTLGATGIGIAALAVPVTVNVVDAGGGSAASGLDYTALGTQTVAFPAGSGTATVRSVTLVPTNDLLVEGNETVRLGLQHPTGPARLGNPASTVTINDDDTATLSIEASDTATEEGGVQTTNVSLALSGSGSGPAALAVGLTASVVDAGGGTADRGSDYASFGTQSVSFAAGAAHGASETVDLTPLNDLLVEVDETVNLRVQGLSSTLDGQAALGTTTGTVTIQDDDMAAATVSIQATDWASEPGGVQTTLVSLSLSEGAALTAPVTVEVVDAGGGSAFSGTDYAPVGTQLLTFPVGSASGATQNVSLSVINDLLVERSETVNLKLQNLTGPASLGTASSTVTIGDDDTASLMLPAVDFATEAGGTQSTDVTLTLSGTGSGSAALAWPVSAEVIDAGGGTASSGTDYNDPGTQTVTFAAGSTAGTTQAVSLAVLDDLWAEGSETIHLQLQNPTPLAALGNSTTIVTILDDENSTVSIPATDTAGEANGPQTTAVTLTLSSGGSLAVPVTVQVVDTGGGTADSGTDYAAFSPQTLTFAAGSTSGTIKTVTLNPVNDLLVEGGETVQLALHKLTGPALLGTAAATVTIGDDDSATLAIQATDTAIEQGGPRTAAVTLTLGGSGTGTAALAVGVSADVVDAASGTATSGADYAPIGTQTVSFPAGSTNGTSQAYSLTPINDLAVEGQETVQLALKNPSVPATLGTAISTITVDDDDMAALSIQATDTADEQGGPQTTVVTLTLSGSGTGPASLAVGLTGQVVDAFSGTAFSGTDYAPFGTQTVTFAVGSADGTRDTVTLTPLDDTSVEPSETVNLTLQNLSAASKAAPASLGTTAGTVTILDNDRVNVPPVLAPIGDQVSPPGATSHAVTLSATDADGDPLSFGATVTKLEFYLDQLLDLSIPPEGVQENRWGGGEKWLTSPSSLKRYYILPAAGSNPERLFEWDHTPSSLNGTLIANLNDGTHANPSLLTGATPTPVPTGVSVNGNLLTLTKTAGFHGRVLVTAIVTDGRGGVDSESFQTTFTPPLPPAPPVLAPIGDRTSAPGANNIEVNLSATDVNNDPLTFSAAVTTLELTLDQQLDLSAHSAGFFENLYRGGEKWLYAFSTNKWYYILPNEELYEWDLTPFVLSGTFIAKLNPGTYADPARLYDPLPIPATATLAANALTITKTPGFFGSVLVTVTVDDGQGGQDTETFKATFAPAARWASRSAGGLGKYRQAVDAALHAEEFWGAAQGDDLASRLTRDRFAKP